jgi:AraC family transcriptional regulator
MEVRIASIPSKKLVGFRIQMNLQNNKTPQLWQQFMPRRKEITNNIGTDLYSVQCYDDSLKFEHFTPATIFEKWAAIEVGDFDNIPEFMEAHELSGGKYAVFIHRGTAADFHKTYQFIFGHWLPNSSYDLDQRAHFEILGDKYKNDDPTSEEEVWIPVKDK